MLLLGLATLVVFLTLFTSLPNVAARALEMEPRLERADAIVVLGNGIGSDGSLQADSLRSVVHGIELYRRGLAPLLVVSGSTSGRYAEAVVRGELARTMGVPDAALIVDATGTTTRQESARIAALLRSRGAGRILLVTTPFHLRRAVPLFQREGLEVLPAPATRAWTALVSPGDRVALLRSIAVETAAQLYYRVAGHL